ncbi:hypothetical protein EGY31_27280 [Burkholderia multivorans]|nr:hypothetical protein EGY31_27280 [Burkholderia multivorans]
MPAQCTACAPDAHARCASAGSIGVAASRCSRARTLLASPAAPPTSLHRAAFLIKPHSVFWILLVGELPTVFPTDWSAKGECSGRTLRALTG